jgi:ribosomal protein L37AE/L43A
MSIKLKICHKCKTIDVEIVDSVGEVTIWKCNECGYEWIDGKADGMRGNGIVY